MDNSTFTHKGGGEVTIIWEDDSTIASVELWGKICRKSYLGGSPMAGASLPSEFNGIIMPLNKAELDEIILTGGEIVLYVDDLIRLQVRPIWWDITHEMVEPEVPWPLAEEDIGGEEIGFPISALLAIFGPPEEGDEDPDLI